MKRLKLCNWKKIDFTVRNIVNIKLLESCVLGKTLNTLSTLNQREEINAFVNRKININEQFYTN